jgi:benzoylformate decarboxylase
VVSLGDWLEDADPLAASAPEVVLRPRSVCADEVHHIVELIGDAAAPAIVIGAGSATPEGWEAVTALAERLGCLVWREPFSSRAGFPEAHPLFAGHLPWMRRRLRDQLAAHDLVLAVGTSAFRGYLFDAPVPLVQPGARVAVISDDPAEVHRSRSQLAVLRPRRGDLRGARAADPGTRFGRDAAATSAPRPAPATRPG